MRVENEVGGIVNGAQVAAEQLWDGIKNFPSNVKAAREAAKNAAPVALEASGGNAFSRFVGAQAKAAVWLVEQPVAFLLKPVKWASRGTAKFYSNNKILAPVLTVGAAAVGIGSWLTHRKAQAAQDQYMAVAAMAPQMSNPYYNSVTPQEAAMLNARLKENSQGAGFGDQVMAARAGAQPENAPAA